MRWLLCLSLLGGIGIAPAVAADSPPNIVLLIGDDQAWGDYGFTGHPHIQTPHLDRLASQSLVFQRGYVPTSLCRASLATMITGLFPHQHKITSNDPPLPPGKTGAAATQDDGYLAQRAEMIRIFEQSPTLSKLLEEKNYISHQSGKWWEGNACRCGGFTEGMTHGDPAKGGRHGDVGLTIGRTGLKPVNDFITKANQEKKPFFLWYAPMMPHTPHNPPERLLKKYRPLHPSIHVAKYWAMCEWFDETIGDLLAHLEREKLAENTIVIYLHDNGWIQDETSPAYAPRSKRSQYEGGIRTPIIIRWPGKVAPGQAPELASSVDLVPTVLTAVGLKPSSNMAGINLLDAQARAKRDAVFGEIFEHNAIDITKPAANLQYRWVIENNLKLIIPVKQRIPNGVVELYDLAADPKERSNLAAQQPKTVERLQKRLDNWWPGIDR
ncbi:sulfatase family protein [Tuwongella immobilis]|uniref:Sulfatase N-terminal domain-containing protein n=1 Tax=Tuwongella immobilis TaxID=692036 RepID=A0A6C2YVE1_9BACT|nr:sulfatase [Tuwongella immobilis]VIP05466.1 sulfatase atsg : Probable sulfatase atsG OS=Blastopirellula marina DSM 3645 GN=DSM3645_23416 PE=4 SV=1: Sulfatase [Tuwongella immobilis]VTS08288.1 sulfatase atsg : Probable sulfatase atsG OS=Blastopirellula marina DSM 3645 GN=DSM3645_23416 PE=4 SV=1: Sulfatase [Tuwongella immobilis]